MTPPPLDAPESAASGANWHAGAGVLVTYMAGELDGAHAWSIESHVAECAVCRAKVSQQADGPRLARNRAIVLALAAVPRPGRLRRLARRCGMPEHLLVLLSATPSLRRSWLLSVIAVLGVVTAETLLVRALWPKGPAGSSYSGPELLTPFLLVGPLLVLAVVAAAFMPALDPGHRLAVAAPFSSLTLLLVRAVSTLLAALVPVTLAAALVPGPGWLPAGLLLPSLALCAFALAAATVVGPGAAVLAAGAMWAAPVAWLAVTRSPLESVQVHSQSLCAVVIAVAVAVVFVRRDRLELRWAS